VLDEALVLVRRERRVNRLDDDAVEVVAREPVVRRLVEMP